MVAKKKDGRSQWELEKLATGVESLEDLVNMPVFRAASDDKGHSATISIRCPEWLTREFTVIKEAPGSPYDVQGDAVRDAVFLGHIVLQLRQKGADANWSTKVKISQIIDRLSNAKRLQEDLEGAENSIAFMCKTGETARAVKYIDELVSAIIELPEDSEERIFQLKIIANSQIIREVLPGCSTEVKAVLREQSAASKIIGEY